MSFFLAHVSDPHLLPEQADEFAGINPWVHLEACLADLTSQYAQFGNLPGAILCTGDIIHEDPDRPDWAKSYRLFARAVREKFPNWNVYITPGNHDHLDLMLDAYTDETNLIVSAERVTCHQLAPGWKLLALHSQLQGNVGGRLTPADALAVIHYLAAHAQDQFILALHHQPDRLNCQWLDSHRFIGIEDFISTLAVHPDLLRRVRLIAHGHIHQSYFRYLNLQTFRSDEVLTPCWGEFGLKVQKSQQLKQQRQQAQQQQKQNQLPALGVQGKAEANVAGFDFKQAVEAALKLELKASSDLNASLEAGLAGGLEVVTCQGAPAEILVASAPALSFQFSPQDEFAFAKVYPGYNIYLLETADDVQAKQTKHASQALAEQANQAQAQAQAPVQAPSTQAEPDTRPRASAPAPLSLRAYVRRVPMAIEMADLNGY